jgi:Fe-S-cluster containining protein
MPFQHEDPKPRPDRAGLDCQRCGACCAVFRVSFYWAEADDAPGGTVPAALTRPVGPLHRCMAGTEARPVRCVALRGEVGGAVACGIYAQRSSTCRDVQPGDAQCRKARGAHGLETPDAAAISTGPDAAPDAR